MSFFSSLCCFHKTPPSQTARNNTQADRAPKTIPLKKGKKNEVQVQNSISLHKNYKPKPRENNNQKLCLSKYPEDSVSQTNPTTSQTQSLSSSPNVQIEDAIQTLRKNQIEALGRNQPDVNNNDNNDGNCMDELKTLTCASQALDASREDSISDVFKSYKNRDKKIYKYVDPNDSD